MKKLINLMLMLAFLAPLAACGKKGELEAPEGYRPSDETEASDTNDVDR